MASPVGQWDLIPVYGVYMTAPGDTPVQGNVQFKLSQRITRTDGRTIYPDGAKVQVTIGAADQQDATVRAAVRSAWRAADQVALGGAFDGSAWDVWWDTYVLPAAIFTGFPAADDPDIAQRDWTVNVKEALTGANGREYAIQPLLSQLGTTIPGINLGSVEVPPGSPSVPSPVYAKGVAGGVAALDADGDVVDSDGVKITAGGGGLPEDATLADLAETETVKYFTAANQSKLMSVAEGATANDTDENLKSRANHTGTQAISTVTGLQSAIDAKAPTASPTFTGTVSGVTKAHVGLGLVDNTSDLAKPLSTAATSALAGKADLVGGLVPTAQLPPLAINETFTAASQAAMLALTAQRGDMAIRTDTGRTFVLSSDSPATLADWKEVMAAGQVSSVAGKTGTVSLVKGDIGLGSVDNTSDAAKPVSTAQATAINAKIGSPNASVTGIERYADLGSLPATGVAGVIYFVDAE